MNFSFYTKVYWNCFLLGVTIPILSQNIQDIRGRLLDVDTKTPLISGAVFIKNTDFYTTTDSVGNFILKNVPIGKQEVFFHFLGYKPSFRQITLNSGKSIYLEVSLSRDIEELEEVEVVVKSKTNAGENTNEMVMTSARSFAVKETERYAGSMGDPARMVQNFAGVSGSGDSRNDIVIRGNPSYGLLWLLEGVEISNPNHFGSKSSSGGAITILNNNLLANSNFYSGAYPAEFGNSYSGVFDLSLRKGHPSKYEITAQFGLNGLETGIEGPIPIVDGTAVFLTTYRYANWALISPIIQLDGGAPNYQDLTIKMNFDTYEKGSFSLIIIGGLANVKIKKGKTTYSTLSKNFDISSTNNKGIVILKHSIPLNANTSFMSYTSFSADQNNILIDSLNILEGTNFKKSSTKELDFGTRFGLNIYTSLNYKHIFSAGASFVLNNSFYLSDIYAENQKKLINLLNIKEIGLYQSMFFGQWKYNISSKLSFTTGLHINYLIFNNTYALEPRLGLKYKIENHTFGIGYGIASKPLPYFYYYTGQDNNSLNSFPNKNLKLMSNNQISISHNWSISLNLRIKTELYYQKAYHLPIFISPNSYSIANFGASFETYDPGKLVSNGIGENFGLELTIEKFFENKWYIMNTISLFRSFYKASDIKWRSTQYDKVFLFNVVGGYEFEFDNNTKLTIDNKLALNGGYPLVEFLPTGQIDHSKIYSKRSKTYFKNDIKIALTLNYLFLTHELAVDIQNVTNFTNDYFKIFDSSTKKGIMTQQMGILPILTYRLTF